MLHYQNEIVFLKDHNPTLWEELIQDFKKNKLISNECCPFYLISFIPDEDKAHVQLTNKMSSLSEEDYNNLQCAHKAKYITIEGLCNLLNYYSFPDSVTHHMTPKILKWWEEYKQTILTNHYNNILNQNGIIPDFSQNESVFEAAERKLSESYSNLLNNSNAFQTSFDQLKEENIVLNFN